MRPLRSEDSHISLSPISLIFNKGGKYNPVSSSESLFLLLLCRKKAMEAEVLRSKTEMMMLNNHLLEAAQKRLELSLELEAWKVNFG